MPFNKYANRNINPVGEGRPDSEGHVDDPFIEFGSGGRKIANHMDDPGVAEGVGATAQAGPSGSLSNDFVSKNS